MAVNTPNQEIYTRRHHLYQYIYVDNRDLSNNQITTLPQGVFHGLSSLTELYDARFDNEGSHNQ